jgi:ABC-type molybdate transport system ATPase subunit
VALLADRIVVMVHGRVTAAGTLAHLAAAADVAWREEDNVPDAPIERIYRVLVQRGRERLERAPLRLLQEDAA